MLALGCPSMAHPHTGPFSRHVEVIDRFACVACPGGMCRPLVVESLLAPTVVCSNRAILGSPLLVH